MGGIHGFNAKPFTSFSFWNLIYYEAGDHKVPH